MRALRTCRHFRPGGLIGQECNAGVHYRDVTKNPDEPGSFFRTPCKEWAADDAHAQGCIALGGQGTCEKRDLPTYEEQAADDAEAEIEIQKSIERFTKVLPLLQQIKTEHRGQDWVGEIVCPSCGGKLRVRHAAYNGHVAGQCQTADCLSFME